MTSSQVGLGFSLSSPIFAGSFFLIPISGRAFSERWPNNRTIQPCVLQHAGERHLLRARSTFDSRDQQVVIANAYRQDFIWKGYTSQLSFHANFDGASTKYDRNGFLVRPTPFGTFDGDPNGPRGHNVQSYYLGWAGDGHIGKLNINHAFYQVLGRDEFNQFAGRKVDINAQMAALELSLDRDWIRFKLSGFYASGDFQPTPDGVARGFDSIQDNPFFIGGPFSWYVREGFNLAGTGVGLKERNSLVPSLCSSKTQGQSNFVNPGNDRRRWNRC